MKGRLYDPRTRRMLSPDPLASAPTNAGLHPYAYAMNDPVSFTDPSGYAACSTEIGEVAKLAGGTTIVSGSCEGSPGWKETGLGKDGKYYGISGDDDGGNPPDEKDSGPGEDFTFTSGYFDYGASAGPRMSAGVSDGNRTSVSEQSSLIGFELHIESETIHKALDVGAMIPVVGDVFDFAKTILCVYEGKYAEAALSAAGLVVPSLAMAGIKKGISAGGGLGGIKAALGGLADTLGGAGKGAAKVGSEAAPQLTAAAQRAVRSLEARMAEHEAKLTAYRQNPFAFDNRGDLARNATRPEVQQRIIEGRIRHLEGEIKNFQNQLAGLISGRVEP